MTCLVLTLFTMTPILADTVLPTLASEGAILIDGDTGQILYEKNAYAPYAPASITKLMTALLTLESLAPHDEITFSNHAVMSIERGSSNIGMRENEIITVENALYGLLLQSANEVANALAEEISGTIETFADTMNQRAIQLGAKGTHFVNPNGLYDEDHYTTAYDMALITKELLKHDYFLEIMSHSSWQIPPTNIVDEIRYLHQSHKLLNPTKAPKLYREDTIAGKSGYTTKSGYTLVTVARQGTRTLIAVSLKTTASHLYSDTNALLDYGFSTFESLTLTSNDYSIILPITDNTTPYGEATVTLAPSITLQLPIGTKKESLTYQPTLPVSLEKDASLNTVVGEVSILMDHKVLTTVPLTITDIYHDPILLEPSPTAESERSQVSKHFNYWKLGIIIFFIGIIMFLIFFTKSKTLSYKKYKQLRDANPQSHHSKKNIRHD